MAYRNDALEREDQQEVLTTIMNGITNLMRVHGADAKPQKFMKTLGLTAEDAHAANVRREFGMDISS